jgi:hypothetical protein
MTPGTRRTSLLVVALLGAGLLAVPAQAAPTWIKPPTPVSDPALDSTWQQVDMNARGDTMAVWSTNTDGYAQAVWRPAGRPWGEAVTVSDPTHFTQEAYVAVDDKGRSTMIWRDTESFSGVITARTRSAAGTWDTATPLSDESAFHARIAEEAGNTAVTWYESVPATSDYLIRVAYRRPGRQWNTKTIAPAAEQFDPEVAMGAGLVAVVWRDRTSGDSVLTASVRSKTGAWSDPAPLSGAGDAQDASVVIDRQGRVTAIWRLFDGVSNAVIQTRTRNVAGTWGPVKDVSATNGQRALPDVAVDTAGTLTAVWVEQADPTNIVMASVRRLGESWSEPKALSDPEQDAWNPAVAAGPAGRTVITWSLVSPTETRDTVWATTSKGAHTFKAATRIAPLAEENATQPRVAVDGDGDAVVVSRRWDASHYVIHASPLDAAPPSISQFSVPARGTVGTRLRFSATIVDTWSKVVSVVWSFGDGGTAQGRKVRHTFRAPGRYTVKLITTDSVGNTRARKKVVVIVRH